MKTQAITCLLTLAAALSAAAQKPDGRGERRPPPALPLVAVIDTDHDGVLSADEIKTAGEALATLDKNNDGEITPDELRLPPPPPPREPGDQEEGQPPARRPAPPVIAALDTDRDGTISATELKAAPESLKSLDKNGDGELSPEELRPQGPPPRADGPKGGGRPQGPPPGEEEGGAE
jgi:hypothetical protein